MNTIKSIIEGLEILATKLGITVNDLFFYFVKQQYMMGLEGIIKIILTVLIGTVAANKIWKTMKTDKYNDIDFFFITILFGLFLFGTAILIISWDAVWRCFNPEFYAIQDIVNLLKRGK